MKRHILVIGDLSIDHDIFGTELDARSHSGSVELRFSVVRRQDTAGSAATSARILSILNDGDTYLWGIVGNSHWGSFRQILERSQAIDGASRPIELRGVRDETDPSMDTVTRILVVSKDQPHIVERRFCRYYDSNHVHVPEIRREAVLYHLDHIHDDKTNLHAIVINDFERKTLTKTLIEAIAERAARYRVPLFVDPHYDRKRYSGIKAAAILPNLREWCELVRDTHDPDYWRNNLENREALHDMAVQSFRHLGNFEHHIIKCDRDGAVVFVPHAEKRYLYSIYRLKPVPTNKFEPLQMGCGDIMTAAFALEFPKENPSTDKVLRAIQAASATVACYRDMAWHQMPSRQAIAERQSAYPWTDRLPDAEVAKGILFLPHEHRIDMSDCETAIKGLFSQDQAFKKIVSDFLKDLLELWTPGESLKSLILGAPPGSGKTTILRIIREIVSSHGIDWIDMTSTEEGPNDFHMLLPAKFRETFRKLREEYKGQHLLILLDEALREPTITFLRENAPNLLNAAHAEGMRFLFASTGFTPEFERRPEWIELTRRCQKYYLPNLGERPFDVPYIVAARFFGQRESLTRLDVDGQFLLAVTDLALVKPEPSMICDIVDEVLRNVSPRGTKLSISVRDLPDGYRREGSELKENLGTYEFWRWTNAPTT